MQVVNLTEAKAKLSSIISRVEKLESIPKSSQFTTSVNVSMVLISGNKRHFTNIPGLHVEDWIHG